MAKSEFLIIANWKADAKVSQTEKVRDWLRRFWAELSGPISAKVVICPPFPLIYVLAQELARSKTLPLYLGVQNLSPFSAGAHTGEVTASMLKGLAGWAILGHSERRREQDESDEQVTAKVSRALEVGITPIVCLDQGYITSQIQGLKKVSLATEKMVFAYEPGAAIGTGRPETADNAQRLAARIVKETSARVLYGGSVTAQNAAEYLSQESVSGLLVGGASTEPVEFAQIVKSAQEG